LSVRRDGIALKGGRAGFGYTLDEPAQGALAVRLTLGGDRPWCAAAPGRIDVAGRFVAVPRTAAPLDCPALP
jgi:hypothetical protein